jgi:hypothetical protein
MEPFHWIFHLNLGCYGINLPVDDLPSLCPSGHAQIGQVFVF